MDSVIAKLDNSVFGMLIEQPPRILVCGVKTTDDVDFINAVRPDFICLDDTGLKNAIGPVVRVIGSPDDLPVISGSDDPRAMKIDAGSVPEDTVEAVKRTKPDTVVFDLEKHDDDEYSRIRKLIRAVRSVQPEMTD